MTRCPAAISRLAKNCPKLPNPGERTKRVARVIIESGRASTSVDFNTHRQSRSSAPSRHPWSSSHASPRQTASPRPAHSETACCGPTEHEPVGERPSWCRRNAARSVFAWSSSSRSSSRSSRSSRSHAARAVSEAQGTDALRIPRGKTGQTPSSANKLTNFVTGVLALCTRKQPKQRISYTTSIVHSPSTVWTVSGCDSV